MFILTIATAPELLSIRGVVSPVTFYDGTQPPATRQLFMQFRRRKFNTFPVQFRKQVFLTTTSTLGQTSVWFTWPMINMPPVCLIDSSRNWPWVNIFCATVLVFIRKILKKLLQQLQLIRFFYNYNFEEKMISSVRGVIDSQPVLSSSNSNVSNFTSFSRVIKNLDPFLLSLYDFY